MIIYSNWIYVRDDQHWLLNCEGLKPKQTKSTVTECDKTSWGDICPCITLTLDDHIHPNRHVQKYPEIQAKPDSQTAWLPCLPTWKLQSCFSAWPCQLNLATSAPNRATSGCQFHPAVSTGEWRQTAWQGVTAESFNGEKGWSKTQPPLLYLGPCQPVLQQLSTTCCTAWPPTPDKMCARVINREVYLKYKSRFIALF